jgi:alanyl-tRNA synthetase
MPMDASEYDLAYFHRQGFRRAACEGCGHAFWTLGEHRRCQEAPCTPYGFLGHPIFARPYALDEMRETFLRFFERRGHARVRRYPTVARWRNDVFFTQATIYDFQPWVTSGELPPPANPLALSQPCLRFNDLAEVGVSGRHFTEFEMMAHHAFNRPDHEVYFKDRTVELCHELLTHELGAEARSITYKEEEWEGGGNLGPSLSVGASGLELATLVFMEYVRRDGGLAPMPLTVVDTGYGLERFTWAAQGTRTGYEAVFGETYDEVRRTFPPREAAILIDHARSVNFLITDGVVPSNSREGYFARLVLRRMIRILQRVPEAPTLLAVLDRVARDQARHFPEIGEHRDDLHRVIEAEEQRFQESLARGRELIRRQEQRLLSTGATAGTEELIDWYDSLGVPPDVSVEELAKPPPVPENFYALVAERHAGEARETDYAEPGRGVPEPPAALPPTQVDYYLDPYTLSFRAHVLWTGGPWVVLDRTYFYPTGGGQLTDTGFLAECRVVEVARRGRWVLHRLDGPVPFAAGDEVHGRIDGDRRRQLMQHHTATHLLNGALRAVLGPHVWQAGAFKGPDEARIDITHFRALSPPERAEVERLVHRVIREDRPVKSYFEPRTEAERRFGFTLYQGGAVPGKDLRIVEIEGFDVEACGGTHCTHTSEVGTIQLLDSERIQDGVVRLTYAAGERALQLRAERDRALETIARELGVPVLEAPQAVGRLREELAEMRQRERQESKQEGRDLAERLLADPKTTERVGATTVTVAKLDLDRNGLMELSRSLTRRAPAVAILAGESDGRGLLFVGSTAESVPATAVLDAMKAEMGGRGGGNPSAATAVGEPGEPLVRALELGRRRAGELATASAPAR